MCTKSNDRSDEANTVSDDYIEAWYSATFGRKDEITQRRLLLWAWDNEPDPAKREAVRNVYMDLPWSEADNRIAMERGWYLLIGVTEFMRTRKRLSEGMILSVRDSTDSVSTNPTFAQAAALDVAKKAQDGDPLCQKALITAVKLKLGATNE